MYGRYIRASHDWRFILNKLLYMERDMEDMSQLFEAYFTVWKSVLKLTLYGTDVTASWTVLKLIYCELHLTLYERYIIAGRDW